MGSIKYTSQLRLPQFGPSDKPSWQGDVNRAFASIDDGQVSLLSKIADLQQQILTLQTQVTTLQSKVN